MMNRLLECLEIATKNTQSFSHDILYPSLNIKIGATNNFHLALPIFLEIEPMPNPRISVPQPFTMMPPKISDQLSGLSFSRIGICEF